MDKKNASPAMDKKSADPAMDMKSADPAMEVKSASSAMEAKSPAREEKTLVQQMKQVYDSLQKPDKLNLFGPRGVGKTRMAKKLSERAIIEKQFTFTLWVFMCREYTRESLSMSIARQLFLIHANEEWEVEDDNNEQERHHAEVPNTDKLIQDIQKKLLEDKKLKILVIIDYDGDDKTKTSYEEKFWSIWEQMFPPSDKNPNLEIKTIIISRLKMEGKDFSDENAFEIKPLPREHSIKLLKEKLDPRLQEKIHNLGIKFIEKFNGDLPGTVIMIAKVLNYFCFDTSGISFIEKELEEATENYRISKLLCMKHDVLPLGILKDLWWRGDHFYRDSGSVHYSELISYWIVEGYLGDGSMIKLYQKGHGVLMDLIDLGVFKVQEGGYVSMDNSLINVDDLYQFVDQNPSLGLSTAIKSEKEGFGRLTYNDGMLKTTRTRRKRKDPSRSTSSDERGQDLSTLLLDGTHATEQVIVGLFESEPKLQVFGLFYPTIKSLPMALENMNELRVLVLRGCEFLKEAKPTLHSLEFLEISGARNLKRLTSSFFKNMLKLKSLHISGLPIKNLPQAIYNLPDIQWLIIKDCPKLKKLDSLSKLQKLIVVDLSGNLALDTLDKNFLKFENLQSLNLSETMVSTTPLLKNRAKLNHLLCRRCPGLVRLRGLSSLISLQTIDLSGSKDFEEFHDSSLESLKSLITLDLSETGIDRLPINISKPQYLYLKNCLKLTRLSCIESFERLEVLNLSGSKNLNEIENEFFDDMKCVRELNLSETNISHLPSLKNLSNLRKLFLSHCSSLIELPSLESATKLEILDASNCLALRDIQTESFKKMSRLQKIDFSETSIVSFPSLPDPCNIRQLLLKKCIALTLELNVRFPNLEELNLSGVKCTNGAEFVKDACNLKILDLSYTSIEELPSISKLTNLTRLFLAGCKFSSEPNLVYPDIKIEVLDLSKSSIKSLPEFDYTNLHQLMLKDCLLDEKIVDDFLSTQPRLEYIEYPKNSVECTQEEANHQDEWNICKLSDNKQSPVFLSADQFPKKNHPTKTGSYHICAVPVKVEDETWDAYLQRHELVFSDVYLQTSRFAQYKSSLQLRGFNKLQKGIEKIIKDTELVSLIDYKCNGFTSGFDPSMFNHIKGCWIERCNEMVTIFTFGIFDNLTSLFIESCPELTVVFSSSWNPKNLQVLEIKYCDNITEIGGELPKSLQIIKIWECPKLQQPEGMLVIPEGLKTLWISGVNNLKNLISKSEILETLKVENCPLLENLEWKKLKKLHLKELPKLKHIDANLSLVKERFIKECPNLQQTVD